MKCKSSEHNSEIDVKAFEHRSSQSSTHTALRPQLRATFDDIPKIVHFDKYYKVEYLANLTRESSEIQDS